MGFIFGQTSIKIRGHERNRANTFLLLSRQVCCCTLLGLSLGLLEGLHRAGLCLLPGISTTHPGIVRAPCWSPPWPWGWPRHALPSLSLHTSMLVVVTVLSAIWGQHSVMHC